MSSLDHNSNGLPAANPGPAPVLAGLAPSPGPRAVPFSQPFVPQAGGPSGPPELNFQVRRSLRMHGKLALLVGLAVCAVLVALGLTQPQTYTATSFIYVEPMVARNLNDQGVPGFDQFRYGSFLDQQMQTIVRPDVLTAALRSLPPGMWRGPLESEQSAVARLAKALTVERAETSYQITVALKVGNPEAAAAIVNAVTKAYLQRGREDEFKQADLREQILSEERDRVKRELETDRKEQAALGASMGLASPADGAANPYDADLANLRTQLATARQARDLAAAQLESVSGQDAQHQSGLSASADELINTDPGLSAKKAAVNARRVVLESAMAGMTPANPAYRQAQDEIADLDRALQAKTVEVRAETERRIEDKLRADLQRTADVESKINEQLAQATAKATGAGPKLQRAAELANDIQRLTSRYTTIDETLNALQIETNGPGMAHVPLPAAVPLTPDASHRDLFFMAALPLGLLFGVSAAVIARMRDCRVYLGSDLQEAVGFAPMAVLPAREDVSGRVLEEYVLRLAAGVESAYRMAGAQSFVVSAVSAGTDTGRLIGDLAQKLVEMRLQVIVVRASELLVTSQETIERQVASAALADASMGTPQTMKAGEGIASVKLERMKGQHGIILIDAAPLLHSAATEYAARCADATILVAESGATETDELAAATGLLSRLRVAGVAAVLDHVKLEQADEPFRSAVRVVEQRSLEVVAERTRPFERESGFAAKSPVRPDTGQVASEEDAPAGVPGPDPGSLAPETPVEASTAPEPEDSVVAQASGRRSVKEWSAHPVGPSRKAFDLQPGAASAARMTGYAQRTGGEMATAVAEPEHETLDAATEGLRRSSEYFAAADGGAAGETTGQDDSAAVGRLAGDSDALGAVPSHTRSKIRLAFKEQEVNSKTTWFSKLFRGDPPANFRIVPEDDGSDDESIESPDQQWEQPRTRLPEPAADGDPELSHLLKRIKTSAEVEVPTRRRPLAPVAPEPEPPGPFVERRSEPRLVEPEESRDAAAPEQVAAAPENTAEKPAAYAPLSPQLPPMPAWFAARENPPVSEGERASQENTPAPIAPAAAQAGEEPKASGRPLRPFTFQELAGEVEPEVVPKERSETEYPVQQSDATPAQASSPSNFPAPMLGAGALPSVPSVDRTGTPMWPAKEPAVRAFAPRYGSPEESATADTTALGGASVRDARRAVEAAPAVPQFGDAPVSRQNRPMPAASSPSARLAASERAATLPNPMTDPVPVHRVGRLANASAIEQAKAPQPTPQTARPAVVPDVPSGVSSLTGQGVRQQTSGQRKNDGRVGGSEESGLTRRWKLLSQFEPAVSNPQPNDPDGNTRAAGGNPPRSFEEG